MNFFESLTNIGKDALTGGISRALHTDNWKAPWATSEETSWDDLMGIGTARDNNARPVGRAVGALFTGGALGSAVGGTEAGAAGGTEAGATEVGADLPLAEEAGAGAGVDSATGLTQAAPAASQIATSPEQIISGTEPGTETAPANPAEAVKDAAKGTTAREPGIVQKAMNWVNAKPINTAVTYGAVSGIGNAVLTSQAAKKAAEEKRRAEFEARDYQRQLVQGNPSVGGRGVNLNIAPGNRVLLRPDGTPVYRGGIINRAMSGG